MVSPSHCLGFESSCMQISLSQGISPVVPWRKGLGGNLPSWGCTLFSLLPLAESLSACFSRLFRSL